VALAEAADVVVIAPATADTIARLAAGRADDILTCTVLTTKAPVIMVPAMNDNMYSNLVTQENIKKLKARDFIFIEPEYGRLASGKEGRGRLAEVGRIIGIIKRVLGRDGDLTDRKIVITAGGTREPIDPIRYIGNRSSGKMGYALAEAARDRGAEVKLITTAALSLSAGIDIIPVESALGMKLAVTSAVDEADALIMAAAVTDYRLEKAVDNKIKKERPQLTLELVKTPDILSEAKGDFIKVGFAAETEDLIPNAQKKLKEKKLDLIVANDIKDKNSGFGTDTNKVIIIDEGEKIEKLPLMSKREVADRILDRVVAIFKYKGK
jgi:phosphopantothenoylcysteine decarboxylase/phosphopantothenate--cysteine ligase